MKKEIGVLFLVLLVTSFASAYTHLGDNIYINLNGQNIDLQSAIMAGNFTRAYSGGDSSGAISFGHKASEIIINVNRSVKTLLAAISDGSLNSTLAGISPTNYSGYNLIYGEYASNILVSNATITIDLQQAINDGWFYVAPVCVPSTCISLGKTCGNWSNGCGGTLNCGVCTYSNCVWPDSTWSIPDFATTYGAPSVLHDCSTALVSNLKSGVWATWTFQSEPKIFISVDFKVDRKICGVVLYEGMTYWYSGRANNFNSGLGCFNLEYSSDNIHWEVLNNFCGLNTMRSAGTFLSNTDISASARYWRISNDIGGYYFWVLREVEWVDYCN